ncbi:MAG TPA: DsrE/DsrF/DrsH-like family protein [Actinomycetota bacterium]|jgi:peroxiredoxin family protein|nr:DsrE/DsrF/DrsH-like family protein [Actinomycetota bacterium]
MATATKPKKAPQPQAKAETNGSNGQKKMTIIAWSGTLDKAWPTLILATTAAASGMDVTVFFTFWGLRILQKNNKRITGKGFKQRMLSLFNRGGTDHLGLSQLNMGGMGPMMMKQLAKQYKVAKPAELLRMAQDLGVKLWPCQMSLDLMGLDRNDLIDGLPDTVGAATAIQRMSESEINLFI